VRSIAKAGLGTPETIPVSMIMLDPLHQEMRNAAAQNSYSVGKSVKIVLKFDGTRNTWPELSPHSFRTTTDFLNYMRTDIDWFNNTPSVVYRAQEVGYQLCYGSQPNRSELS
jgi:hypothetical protein